jgi:hypothetical protein
MIEAIAQTHISAPIKCKNYMNVDRYPIVELLQYKNVEGEKHRDE